MSPTAFTMTETADHDGPEWAFTMPETRTRVSEQSTCPNRIGTYARPTGAPANLCRGGDAAAGHHSWWRGSNPAAAQRAFYGAYPMMSIQRLSRADTFS